MKIAVVAAAGKAGRKIVREAKDRGFEVTAFVRKDAEIDGADNVIVRDIFDLTKDDLAGFDAVVDAFGAWTEDVLPLHSTTLAHLCDVLSGTDTRLLVVGGAGSIVVATVEEAGQSHQGLQRLPLFVRNQRVYPFGYSAHVLLWVGHVVFKLI